MTTMMATVPPLLPPAQLDEGGRAHLRVTPSLLHVLEERVTYLTLGDLLSLADDDGEDDGDNGHEKGGVDEDEAAVAVSAGLYRPSLSPACSWSLRPSTITISGSMG